MGMNSNDSNETRKMVHRQKNCYLTNSEIVAKNFAERIREEKKYPGLSLKEVEEAMCLAARFISGCSKDYIRVVNPFNTGAIITDKNVIAGFGSGNIEGLEEVSDCYDQYRLRVNDKYFEISFQFAKTIKETQAYGPVFDSSSILSGYNRLCRDSFNIINCLQIEYWPIFKVKKEFGKVYFSDSETKRILPDKSYVELTAVNDKEKKSWFRAREVLDEIEMGKIVYNEYMRELSGWSVTANGLTPSFDDNKKWYTNESNTDLGPSLIIKRRPPIIEEHKS